MDSETFGPLVSYGEVCRLATHAWAVPGDAHMIDVVNPATGRTAIFAKTPEQVRAEFPGAELVEIAAWLAAKAAAQDKPFHWWPATREQYEEALNVLPPVGWDGYSFCVGEPWDHHAVTGRPRFQAFRRLGDRFERSSRPITVAELEASRGKAVD